MSTEVVHGPSPTFKRKIIPDKRYGLTILGYYTTKDTETAGGVTSSTYKSDQMKKRRAELLGMRTIFFDWWLNEWKAHEGNVAEGVEHILNAIRTTPLR